MITYPNAVDENGNVHNIDEITQKNRASHKYYCLGCSKEMVPVLCKKDRESHFRHKVNDLCNPETYLHNLAKKYLAKQFETQEKFEVSYYATNECPNKDACLLFDRFHWEECSGLKMHTFNLKEEYDTCKIEGVYNGYRADVLLTNSQNKETPPIFLEVSISHNCTPEKLASGNRIIEMKIHSEADFKRPIEENKGPMVPVKEEPEPQHPSYHYYYRPEPEPSFIMFHNFEREFHHDDVKKLDFFALKENGRMICDEQVLPCKYAGSKFLKDSIFEVGLLGGIHWGSTDSRNAIFNFGYAQALLSHQPTRNCHYCSNYPICMIQVEVERINPYTGQKEKFINNIFNRLLSDDKIDKFKQPYKCNNWRLNKQLCHNKIAYCQDKNIFIWEKPIFEDDLPF